MTTVPSTTPFNFESGNSVSPPPRGRLVLTLALSAVLGLAACSTRQAGDKQVGGTVLGAVAGGLAGSAFGRGEGRLIMTGVGTLLGAFVGSEIGQSLDAADKAAAERAAQRSFEYGRTGQSATWSNPDTGSSGTVTPTKTYRETDGTYCREYQQTVSVGGKTEQAYGRACRQPDGSWKIVNS